MWWQGRTIGAPRSCCVTVMMFLQRTVYEYRNMFYRKYKRIVFPYSIRTTTRKSARGTSRLRMSCLSFQHPSQCMRIPGCQETTLLYYYILILLYCYYYKTRKEYLRTEAAWIQIRPVLSPQPSVQNTLWKKNPTQTLLCSFLSSVL